MNKYVVVVYLRYDDWEIINVEANSKLHASIKGVNEVMGYEVYKENNIIFKSIEELNDVLESLGLLRVGEVLIRD
ncbi:MULTISPECIES: hypothetical protein [Bacillus cereus group]|uniref:Uncharacterized protein n=1 Tax=Bacillus cereus TaxID=1396 RepID=A0A9X6VW42_BACCE|nr:MULTISPECIES: hypothetical protein [Bacillus cereus group]PFF46003.1 hypothetical protein CN357_21350 [Bacillus cereus]PFQ36524.1 hypothetical protein COK33_17310 [Bacillus cereus]PGB17856.1 hypothetical protein COM09_03455 [Bacillus toyonensis]